MQQTPSPFLVEPIRGRVRRSGGVPEGESGQISATRVSRQVGVTATSRDYRADLLGGRCGATPNYRRGTLILGDLGTYVDYLDGALAAGTWPLKMELEKTKADFAVPGTKKCLLFVGRIRECKILFEITFIRSGLIGKRWVCALEEFLEEFHARRVKEESGKVSGTI